MPGIYNEKLLLDSLIYKIDGYQIRNFNAYRMEAKHSRETVEIAYIAKGSCTIEIEDTTLHMKEHQLLLINSFVPHRLLVEKNQHCQILNLEFVFTKNTLRLPSVKDILGGSSAFAELLKLEPHYIYLKNSQQLYPAVNSLIEELYRKGKDSETVLQVALSELLIKIFRDYLHDQNSINNDVTKNINKAVDYIKLNYCNYLKIKDIALAVNLHPVYLQRIFKEKIGITILKYITQIKIEKAKEMLLLGREPVSSIILKLGFNNRQHFYYTFKKETGSTPLEFRERNKILTYSITD